MGSKSEGRQWVEHCINLYVDLCKENRLESRSGLCTELLADFRIPKPPGRSQGAQRAVFCAVRVADFPAEGAGGEPPRGVAGELGCLDSECVAKILGFFRSLGKNKLFTHAAEANCFAQVRPGQAMRVHGC